MNGSTSAVAVRNGTAPAQAAPGAALELRPGQTMWTRDQHAALVAMGIPARATSAELGVFLHQCQRLRLDPFTKQIYLIYRRVKEGDRWVEKPTTQIGIDGFRVTRDRIAAERGVSVEYEDTTWYAADGQACDVWLWDEPPAACRFVVKVDGRRFPSVLRFNEYCQFGREVDENGNRPRTGRWRDGHAHQIEKCAEADALRRAFPNDLSGVILEDAAPLSDPDAPDVLPQDRPRVTAAEARARAPQHVTATVVTPDVPPAEPATPSARSEPPAESAGGTPDPGPGPDDPAWQRALKAAQAQFKRFTGDDQAARLDYARDILRVDQVLSFNDLTLAELRELGNVLSGLKDRAALDALLADGTTPGE